jgi:hypothetical protein
VSGEAREAVPSQTLSLLEPSADCAAVNPPRRPRSSPRPARGRAPRPRSRQAWPGSDLRDPSPAGWRVVRSRAAIRERRRSPLIRVANSRAERVSRSDAGRQILVRGKSCCLTRSYTLDESPLARTEGESLHENRGALPASRPASSRCCSPANLAPSTHHRGRDICGPAPGTLTDIQRTSCARGAARQANAAGGISLRAGGVASLVARLRVSARPSSRPTSREPRRSSPHNRRPMQYTAATCLWGQAASRLGRGRAATP